MSLETLYIAKIEKLQKENEELKRSFDGAWSCLNEFEELDATGRANFLEYIKITLDNLHG